MKRSKNQLFDLVKKMTPSEKRYFRIYCKIHATESEPAYLKLFVILCDMIKKKEPYSDKLLNERFYEQSDSKRIDLFKSTLYKKILDSLIEFNKDTSIDFQLRSIHSKVDILNQKGLAQQALRFISNGIKIAEKYEKWYSLLAFVEMENAINYSLQKLNTGYDRQQLLVEKASNLRQFKDLQSNMWKLYLERGLPSTKEELKKYEEVISSDLMADENMAKSYKAKAIFFYLLQFYYGMREDLVKTCEYGEKLIDHLEATPSFILENSDMYLRAMINLQFAFLRLGKYEEIIKSVNKCRKNIQKANGNSALKASIGLSLYINELESTFNLNPEKDLSSIIMEMREHYRKNKTILTEPSKYIYYWKNAIYHFNLKEYKSALDWINKVQQMKSSYREDIQSFSRILLLIIHFELKNKTYLQYCIKSTLRFLKKKNHFYDLEKLFLTFIKNQNKAIRQSKGEERKAFIELRANLRSLTVNKNSHKSFRSIDIDRWIKSRVKEA